MRRAFLLFSLHVFTSLAAAADLCRPVDFRASIGRPRDQGESGWCFAHTAADLLTAKIGVRVSAFDLATTFLLFDPSRLKSSRDIVVREYLALHPEFDQRVNAERGDLLAYQASRILTSRGLLNVGGAEDLAIIMANGKGLCLDHALPDDQGNPYARNLQAIETFFEDLSRSERRRLEVETAHLTHIEDPRARLRAGAFQQWVDRQCGARLNVPPMVSGQYYIAMDADDLRGLPRATVANRRKILRGVLDTVLDQNRAIAIGYDANEVMTPDEGENDLPADHSSLIAARRKTARGCEYFVRNSYGTSCDVYRPEWRHACERGGLWLKFEELSSLYSAVWLE